MDEQRMRARADQWATVASVGVDQALREMEKSAAEMVVDVLRLSEGHYLAFVTER